MALLLPYLALLAVTLAVEVPIAAALAGRGRRQDTALACVAVNLVTHPLAVGLGWLLGVPWLALELGVLALEYLGYRSLARLGPGRAVLVATCANLASATVAVAWWAS